MPTAWDHSSEEKFVEYYAEKSFLEAQLRHFRSVRDAILRVLPDGHTTGRKFDVLDVGCNAGGQCSVWAEEGHKVHGLDVNGPLLEIAKKKAAEDQANLPNAEKAADAATDGQAAATVGQAYFGYQQYDKAVGVLTTALTKGGLKNAADTRLLLGIAQLKAGHKDDAVKTFRQVKGDPTLERLANLWVIHSRQA